MNIKEILQHRHGLGLTRDRGGREHRYGLAHSRAGLGGGVVLAAAGRPRR